MKKLPYLLFAFLIIAAISSCKDDYDDVAPPVTAGQLANKLRVGTWKVTYFIDNAVEETAEFSGYNFTFGTSTAVTAENGINSYAGTFLTSNDEENFAILRFHLGFAQPADFAQLNMDWQVIQSTDNQLRLKYNDTANGIIDYLTLEKN